MRLYVSSGIAPFGLTGIGRRVGDWSLGAALLAGLALASCAPKAVVVDSPVRLPESFSLSGEAAPSAEWWTTFENAELNALMAEAFENNFSLRAAWDRLTQARAIAERSGADLWPSVDGSAGASRSVTHVIGSSGRYRNDFALGISASYEVDLWGRVRSSRDAALLDALAAAEDVQAAAVTLSANIAAVWCEIAEQRGQLRLLDEQIKTNETYLEIITLRFRRGQVSATDVLQQRQLVEQTRGLQALVRARIAVLENLLAVLVGRAPGMLNAELLPELPSLSALPAGGVPIEALRGRPDVRAAERRVQAADRRVGVAVADQFPRLSLSASASTSDEKVRDLFDNWMANLAANAVAPLFDASQRRAEVARSKAVVSERLNDYGRVMLESMREVEDALAREARQTEYLTSLQKQLELARQATEQTLDNYTKGTVDFVRYLTTLLSYQNLQRTYLQAQLDRVLFRIDLHRALAGGWDLPEPEPLEASAQREPLSNGNEQ